MGAGLTLSYSSIAPQAGDNINNLAIGGRFQYNFLDQLRLNGGVTIGLKNSDDYSYWNFGADANYLFPVGSVTLYPLAGLWFSSVKWDGGAWGDWDESGVGLTIGGGIDFPLNDTFTLNGEIKYNTLGVSGCDGMFSIGVGLIYNL